MTERIHYSHHAIWGVTVTLVICFYSVAETSVHKDPIKNLELDILFKPADFLISCSFSVHFITEILLLIVYDEEKTHQLQKASIFASGLKTPLYIKRTMVSPSDTFTIPQ